MSKIDKKEILISGVKSIFGTVPFAGTALNELFFEYRSNLKQKRLNNFVEILGEHFTKDQETNIDNIKTDDFNDLFEAVLTRVVKTKSELKLTRFKDILIKELNNPSSQTELIDIYLDLISSLSEEELILLYHHKSFNNEYDEKKDKLADLKVNFQQVLDKKKAETIIIDKSRYEDEFQSLKNQISGLENEINPLKQYRNPDFYKIEPQKFKFYIQRLYSKGLLIDNGIGAIGTKAFEVMSITEFGTEFINFIKKE